MITPPIAAPASAAAGLTEPGELPAGLYSGVLADGSGTFFLLLDEAEEGGARTAFLYVASENGSLAEECSVMPCASGLFVEIDGETIFKVETGDDCAKLVLVGK